MMPRVDSDDNLQLLNYLYAECAQLIADCSVISPSGGYVGLGWQPRALCCLFLIAPRVSPLVISGPADGAVLRILVSSWRRSSPSVVSWLGVAWRCARRGGSFLPFAHRGLQWREGGKDRDRIQPSELC